MKTNSAYKPNKKLLRALAKEVRALRKAKGLNLEELADLCGLHSKYVQTIERNYRNMSISVFVQIATALGVAPAKLLEKAIKASG